MGKGLVRLPAVTPRTPSPKSVGFQQFCDGLSTDLLGDSSGGTALIRVSGLLQGTQGPNSVLLHPWSMKLQVMLDTPTGRQSLNTYCVSVDTCWNFTRLRQCGHLLEFHTVYVMVDNRNLAEHKRQDPSLPHWPAAARWWHSRLKLVGL